MSAGVITYWNNAKGYGFIKPDKGDRDVFVHISAVQRAGLETLELGQRLAFDVQPDRADESRVRAVDLRLAA
jgi:CspA family cold shock protein